MEIHFLAALAALGCAVGADQSSSSCGVPGAARLQGRIVNGVDASRCEWPWQAGLHSWGGPFCGGTLIAADWVLTAAHCVEDGSSFSIVLGDHDLKVIEDSEAQIGVEAVVVHPRYDTFSLDYDFALVKLATPAPEGECIRAACLPEEDQALPIGEDCFVTGWGTLSSGGSQPDILQEASVEAFEDSECKARYDVLGWDIGDSMFCAQGFRNGNPTDSCQGDSGGPLVCAKGDDIFTLFGVVSWGKGCAEEDFPGVYATVAAVVPWITAYLEGRPVPTPAPAPTSAPTPTPAPTPVPEFPAGSMWVVTSGSCFLDEDFCINSPNFPDHYYDDSVCTIQINGSLAAPIQVAYFETELGYDLLWVNGAPYSGSTPPAGIIPEQSIIWAADYVFTAGGWKLCQDTPPSPPPTPAPEFRNGSMWVVASGSCTLDEDLCITSPYYPQSYDHNSDCAIHIDSDLARPIQVDYFYTEYFFDVLTVNGASYSGDTAPAGVIPEGTISWSADGSFAYGGWRLCQDTPPPPAPTQSPAPTPAWEFPSGPMWMVTSGNCTLDDEFCIMSPNYPGSYEYNSACVIETNASLARPIQVDHFDTEPGYDWLWVNGGYYSGASSPAGLIPDGIIIWSADGIVSYSGWRLCQDPPLPPAPTPALSFLPGSMWLVESGNCVVDEELCITSPNYPYRYDHNSECVIRIDESMAGPIQVDYFETEADWDTLTVNGQYFSGSEPPLTLTGLVPAGEILWDADSTVASGGWRLCPIPELETPPGSMWVVRSGGCKLDPDTFCITSPDPTGLYSRDSQCFIDVNSSMARPMHVEYFYTDFAYHELRVNGESFSSSRWPTDITPEGTVQWRTTGDGLPETWKLCQDPMPLPEALEGAMWAVTHGDCVVDEDSCITSPNYPRNYTDGSKCTIRINSSMAVPIEVRSFETEYSYDFLLVNNETYWGYESPNDVTPEGVIIWQADEIVSYGGWKLCQQGEVNGVPAVSAHLHIVVVGLLLLLC